MQLLRSGWSIDSDQEKVGIQLLWVQDPVRSGKIRFSTMSGFENPSGTRSTLCQNHYQHTRMLVIGYLYLANGDTV